MEIIDAIEQAHLLVGEGRPGEALDILIAAAAEHPEDEDLKVEVALLYAERGLARPAEQGDEALADFAEARKWAELPLALAGMARVLARRGDLDGAEKVLKQALEEDPALPDALVQLGIIEISSGRPADAVEPLSKVIQAMPEYAPAYIGLALALDALGQPGDAHRALLEGRRRCSFDDALLVALGWSFAEREKDFAGARGVWRQAAELNRGNAGAWHGVAWAAAEAGDEVDMIRALDRAVELDRAGTLAFLEKAAVAQPLLKSYSP